MSLLGSIGRLLKGAAKSEAQKRLVSDTFVEEIATAINGKVNIPLLNEEQEQAAIREVVRAALGAAAARLF